ncbi:carbon-nitrogen family hydrolase [Streptacidiphilus pinicola]|uniref:Carbon-nitrogen family hydrolase n=1 Tax=Streptacidiphilus pinicola TaxID=2219663 RepID=A0A2X0I920_9ACTN|nr:carbon-nitrogen family hydrolase [Streptacidiphilus pinicola]RAG81414.1 carbon-nitrogen family hydrolase [Streptacidiphilus pinicola]
MRASLVQIDVNERESADERRARIAELVRAQRGVADLVVLPELWPLGGFAYEAWADGAESLEGPTAEVMSAAARDAGVWLHAGSIVERDPEGPLCNTSLLFAPDGELHAWYRKIHRFGFDSGEAALMAAGQELCVVDTPFGRMGLATCYDLRFPELFRAVLDQGAELFVLPSAWPARRAGHWSLLARARAVEEQALVFACNTAGTHGGVPQAGLSVVVDPWGTVLGEANGGESGSTEEVLTVEFDPAVVARTRAEFPVLRDRQKW